MAILLLASAGWAHADICSTFNSDPTGPYSTWSISAKTGKPLGFAFSFGGEQSYSLDNVKLEMALSLLDGDNRLEVSIMTANTDNTPGTVLKSFSFDGLLLPQSNILTGTPVAGGIGGTLLPDQTYWLVAFVPDGASTETDIGWHLSSLPVSSLPFPAQQAIIDEDGAWQVYNEDVIGAFRLSEVSPVPVPGAVLLGVLGLGYSSWRLRRRGA